jgi:hypothetical protein
MLTIAYTNRFFHMLIVQWNVNREALDQEELSDEEWDLKHDPMLPEIIKRRRKLH